MSDTDDFVMVGKDDKETKFESVWPEMVRRLNARTTVSLRMALRKEQTKCLLDGIKYYKALNLELTARIF